MTLPTRKVQALLAYLAMLPSQPHPRDKLAALLWGDLSQKQARGNLRQALAALRRGLRHTDILSLEGETVALDPRRVSSDVSRFEELGAGDTLQALAEADRLYQGDLLAGLTLREPPFEEWLLAQRERLRELAIEVIARLLAHQRRSGEIEAAVQSALKLLTLDPLQEPAHRTLMRLHVQSGRRSAALRQYQACTAALERDLGTQPEPETRALYQEILRQRPPASVLMAEATSVGPAPAEAVAVPPPGRSARPLDLPATDLPLVGRAGELERLTGLVDAALDGHGRIVGLLGDPGVGKSRLAAEVVTISVRRGARILVGRCFQTEQRPPFGVWIDALRNSGVLADSTLLEELRPVWRSELARLLPELGEAPASGREGGDPLHLFEAICQLIERLVSREPLVILVEDGHWVDEMSLRLLSFMSRRIQNWRLLWIGTFREEEIAGDPMHARIDELVREGLAVRLRLAPLSKADTLALARHLLPPGTADSLDEKVWIVSEGNAFMAVETARALSDQPGGEPAGGALLPERVRELVSGRLDRLSPRGRRVVALAAVIGRQFEFSLLARASDVAEEDAAEAMEELVRRRMFQQSGDGFEFTHDRLREVAYAALLAPQRAILHRRVAEAIEALHGADAPDVTGALAFHWRAAGAWGPAVHHLARFAEQAARGYAHGDAVEACRHAVEALARTPASPARDRQQLVLSLRQAYSLYFLGQWAESANLLVAHSSLLARVAEPALAGPWYAWLGYIYVRTGQHRRARDSAWRAIEEAGRAGDDATAGKAYGVLSFESFWSGRPREGVDLGARAVALLQASAEPWWEGMAHFYAAFNEAQRGQLKSARASLAHMRAIGESIADNRLCNYAAWTTGWTLALEGDTSAAIAACERALELATDPVSAAYAAAFVGYAHLEAGDGDRAVPRLEQAVEDYRRFQFRTAEAWFGALLADARRLQGHVDAPVDLANRALALAREIEFPFAVGLAQRALGRMSWARGAKHEAEALLGGALETFRAAEAQFEAGRTLLDLASIAWSGGDVGRARVHTQEARAIFVQLDAATYVARADQLAGQLG